MIVYLNELHPRLKINPFVRYKIIKTVKTFLKEEKLLNAEISVILSDDSHLADLNLRYRKINKATDVLSFPLEEQNFLQNKLKINEHFVLGEIYISLDRAMQQAKEDRTSLGRRVMFLLAHGLYHLTGYDHNTDNENSRMEAKVNRLVNTIY